MSASGYLPIGRTLSLTLDLGSHIALTFSLPSKEQYHCPQ